MKMPSQIYRISRNWILGFVFLSGLPICGNASSQAERPKQELICQEGEAMGTPFKICVYAAESEKVGVQFDLQKSIKKLNEINLWMSDWIEGTELNKVNEVAGVRPMKVRKELFDLIRFSNEVSELTGGAFDLSFNAFWGLYDFKPGRNREPSEEEIQERLPLVNYREIVLIEKESSVFLKKPGMRIGLGAIGQGYGADVIVADLKKRYQAGFVDGSGDTRFWGQKPNGELWITAIRDPRNRNRDVGRIYGTDFAITTAGDDEKFFMVGDRRVHHILDPKTGKSATASRQVTVIAPTALEADAFDTASFVLGFDKAKAILNRRKLEAVFVTENGVRFTDGLEVKQTQWGPVYTLRQKTNVIRPALKAEPKAKPATAVAPKTNPNALQE